jgi:molecular chaperone DnaJ
VPRNSPDHYEILGVDRRADLAEIRTAYRRLARHLHPDTRGSAASGPESEAMSRINEAWRVLSDPARRRAYDETLVHRSSRPVTAGATTTTAEPVAMTPPPGPARFPWRFVLGLVAVGSIGVIVLSVLVQPSGPAPVDNLLVAGSCVVVEPGELAREVSCDQTHDAVVEALIPFDGRCPFGTVTLRDRQGMGLACVIPVATTPTARG